MVPSSAIAPFRLFCPSEPRRPPPPPRSRLHPTMLSRLPALARPTAGPLLRRALSSAYTYASPGLPSTVLSHSPVDPVPSNPAPGSVCVNWLAAGVDPVDLAALSASPTAASFAPSSLPAVPGSEGVAVVTAVASDVSSLSAGDHVVPINVRLFAYHSPTSLLAPLLCTRARASVHQ